jgi:hypothetical protein
MCNVKLIRYQFDAPDAHFDYSSLFSGTQAEKVGNPKKNCKNYTRAEKTKYCAMKLNHIRGRIELCMRGISLRFEMNLLKKNFFLDSFIHIHIFKQVPKYVLATGL